MLNTNLCSNCVHANNCILQNGRAVQECEEHEVEQLQFRGSEVATVAPQKKNGLEHYQGLCADCALAPICIWKNKDSVVFSCEHYE